MSVEALSWAFQQEVTPAAKKLVLIALANRADEEGYCYPGYKRLAVQCSMARSTVIQHVKALEREGLISISSQQRENGSDTSNLYKLALNGVGSEIRTPPGMKSGPRGSEVRTPIYEHNIQNKKTALTREEFLREIDGQRVAGRFNAYTADESIIAIEAGNVWDYWAAYPDRKPTGDLVAGFIGWLRQSRAVKAAEKLAAKSKASGGSEGAPLAQASQPWHERVAKRIGEAPARAWIYPLHHDGKQIIAPSKFHRDTVIQKFREEIEAEFSRGIPIIVGQIPQEQSV